MRLVFYYPCKFTHGNARLHGPMGVTYLAAHIEKELGIHDIHIEVDPDRVIAHKPDIIGISAYTETYPQALAGAQRFKQELGVPIMLGGPHMNAIPQNFPVNGPFDVGLHGEGEKSVVEMVRRYLQGNWQPHTFGDIPGAIFANGGDTPTVIPKAAYTEDLDTLYYPKREILKAWFPPDQAYGNWRQGLYTSRDCPFRCSFCIHSTIQGMPRYHSPERVINELEHILRYYPQQDTVTIYDDIFVVSKKRLAFLVDNLRAAGIPKKLGFVVMIKASTFNEEVAKLLKAMNVQMIAFGFETGSAAVLKYLKGPGARLKQHQEALDICRKYNLRTMGYFILGSPMETEADMAKSYWFIRHNLHDLHTAGLFCLVPYPGTRFWHDYTERRGTTPDHNTWELFDHKYLDHTEDYPFFINEHYTPEILREAFRTFQDLRPRLASDPQVATQETYTQLYRKALYPYLQTWMPPTAQVLEISSRPYSLFELTQLDQLPITLWDLREPQATWPEGSPFEAIFLNHALEQVRDPQALLQQVWEQTTSHTPIYLTFHNAQFLPVLAALLQGKTPDIFGAPHLFEQLHFYSLKQMQNLLLRCRFKITDLFRNPQPLDPRDETLRLLPTLVQEFLTPEISREHNIYSYMLRLQRLA
jgi:anaerobic magnesium-protoporphyrin IX monomethyl ester cyclase